MIRYLLLGVMGRSVFVFQHQIILTDGYKQLTRLQEQSMSTKLEALFKKNFYQLAVSLARSNGVDEAGIADIYAKYGDYLYLKGDFDGSVAQYVKTLGHLQPSYVIRKVGGRSLRYLTAVLTESDSSSLTHNAYII